MVKITGFTLDLTQADLSMIPSLRCNITCSFCMYDCGPTSKERLDLDDTRAFLATVDWSKVAGCGFYGGEPSIEIPWYDKFVQLLPSDVDRFVITNGYWTASTHRVRDRFLNWCMDRRLHLVISGTPEHQKAQHAGVMGVLAKFEGVTAKGDDVIHPMGRARTDTWTCTKKCIWHKAAFRLGIFPTGDILLQNCDGVYPVVGHIKTHTFDQVFRAAVVIRLQGCAQGCRNVNDVLDEARA